MRAEERQGRTAATADQILGEIRDYCRATQTAEFTFGRLVVNDGKLVSRLRDGAKITTGTLDKVRAYLSGHQGASASARSPSPPTVKPMNGAAAEPPPSWRPPASGFSTTGRNICCSSRPAARKPRSRTGFRSNSAICSPTPPALRIFDAGVGDGTVLSRVMRALHARFPTMPLYAVAKEISYEDVRLTLEKMADRLFEHPATVLVVTNLYYAEAPWLTPRSATSAQSLIWKDVALSGNTAHGFAEQINELERFWPRTGGPASVPPPATRSIHGRSS